MTAVAEQDLSQYAGKKIIVTHNLADGTAAETEGTVQTANSLGLLIKPKGKSAVEIIEAGSIEKVDLVPEKPEELSVQYLKDVELGTARRHLLDRHAATLTEINSMTDEAALELHAGIDHSDLGHLHGEKPKKPAKPEAVDGESDDTASEDDDSDSDTE